MATTALEKIPLTTLRLIISSTWDANQDSCQWVILDHQGKVLSRGKDLLTELPQCDETEVVITASMVGFIAAQLPSNNHSKVLNALPFLVEAGLISAPEETHVVLASQIDAQVTVAVIQKKWIKRLLDQLASVEIFPIRMFPETLLPPLVEDGWSMVCQGESSFVRVNANQGFTLNVDVNHAEAPFVLTLALTQAIHRPTSIMIYGEYPTFSSDWAKQLNVTFINASQQEWLIANSKPSVNLLQGDFAPSGGISRKLVAFKPLSITLACLLALQVGFSLVDYAINAHKNRQLDQEMVAQFKATFPNAITVVDAPLQMQRNLDELKHGLGQNGQSDFLPLLSLVTTSIGGISSERLRSMEYQNGKLIFNITMPDIEQAQAMQQRLIASGLMAAIEKQQATSQGLELQLVITASAS